MILPCQSINEIEHPLVEVSEKLIDFVYEKRKNESVTKEKIKQLYDELKEDIGRI